MTSLSEVATPRLALAIDKLREIAAECAHCGGTGVVTHTDVRGESYARQDFCDHCHDIRDVIARCSA